MKIKDCHVDQGGLMRCCIETLSDMSQQLINYNDIIPCKYCTSTMILVDQSTSKKLSDNKTQPLIKWNHQFVFYDRDLSSS